MSREFFAKNEHEEYLYGWGWVAEETFPGSGGHFVSTKIKNPNYKEPQDANLSREQETPKRNDTSRCVGCGGYHNTSGLDYYIDCYDVLRDPE